MKFSYSYQQKFLIVCAAVSCAAQAWAQEALTDMPRTRPFTNPVAATGALDHDEVLIPVVIKYANAESAADDLQKMFPNKLRVTVVRANNSLVVGGPEALVGKAKEFLALVDVPDSRTARERRAHQRADQFSSFATADLLPDELSSAEVEIQKQVALIRKATPVNPTASSTEEMRRELGNRVRQAFLIRQKLQREQLQRLA